MKSRFYLKMLFLGFVIAFLGGYMNFFVERANYGRMPVFMDNCFGWDGVVIDSRHYCAMANTHFAGLADWISIWGYSVSPGDIFMIIGRTLLFGFAVVFIISALRRRYKKFQK